MRLNGALLSRASFAQQLSEDNGASCGFSRQGALSLRHALFVVVALGLLRIVYGSASILRLLMRDGASFLRMCCCKHVKE